MPPKQKQTQKQTVIVNIGDKVVKRKRKRKAKKRKETIGKYVNRVLLDDANETLSSKKSATEVSLTNEDMFAQMMKSQTALAEQVEALVVNQNKPLMKKLFGKD